MSESRSTHVSTQSVWPIAHDAVHAPATHASFAEQCTPQSPQFALSLAMFAQYG
jgi:hypothetical protein